jgi:hypothetical protein
MRKIVLIILFVQISLIQFGQIIADHTVVDKFDKIPQFYINKVKTMWMSYPGESHSESIRRGLEFLEAAFPRYQVEVAEYTGPAPYTSDYLRADANTWGDLTNATGWIRWYGEEDWYTSPEAIAQTKAGIAYCNTTGPALSAIGFGMCYGTGGGDYITATQSYIDYCTANNYSTKVFFTTGPVDAQLHLYLWTGWYNAIRSYVAAHPTSVLFDFADILCYNNDGSGPNTTTDEGHTVPFITNESAAPNVGGFHFSNEGALRLAKAMWWMLARMAGWDGDIYSGYVWQGGISTDFANTANWKEGVVPPDGASISFADSPQRNCILDKNRTLKNITNSQSVRKLGLNGKKLTITGDLIFSNGAQIDATANGSEVVFSGSSTQNSPAGAFLNNTIANLTSENQAGLSFTGNLIINRYLTISQGRKLTVSPSNQLTVTGRLINEGLLTLNSDAGGIFSLMMNDYAGTGTCNVNMYLTGGGSLELNDYRWHYVAVPATYGNKSVFTTIDNKNLLQYDDSKVLTSNYQGWVWHDGYNEVKQDFSGPSFPDLKFGKGYNFYHNKPEGYTFVTFVVNSLGYVLPAVNLQYSGVTDNNPLYGLNLIGNSLTCSINWDLVTKGQSVRNAIYFTKNNCLVSYVNGSGVPSGTTGIIPPLQGFFVQTNSSSNNTLDFSNAQVRIHGFVNRYKGNIVIPQLRLQLLCGEEVKDETLIRFDKEATLKFDNNYDATKLFSGSVNASEIYTSLDDENYVINGIPLPDSTQSIPVVIKIKNLGNYTIFKTQIEGLENYIVKLVDKSNRNFSIDLKNTDKYTFSSEPGTFADRFMIMITNKTSGLTEITTPEKEFNIFVFNKTLNIELLQNEQQSCKSTVTIYDLSGRKIFYQNSVIWYPGELKQFPLSITKGIYIVEIKSGNRNFISKISVF